MDHKAEAERLLSPDGAKDAGGWASVHATLALTEQVELLKEVIADDRCGIGSLLEELCKQVKRCADAMEAQGALMQRLTLYEDKDHSNLQVEIRGGK